MAKHYDKQFKLDAVQYYHDHKNLGLQGCATNLGISQQTLSRWQKELRETGDIESRGSGNYASDEAKEIARLKRELRDAQDALEVCIYFFPDIFCRQYILKSACFQSKKYLYLCHFHLMHWILHKELYKY